MVYQTPLVFDPCRQMPPIIDHFKIKLKMVLLLFIYIFYAFSQGSLPRAFGIEKSISSKKKKNKRKKEYQSQYSHYLLIWTFVFFFSSLVNQVDMVAWKCNGGGTWIFPEVDFLL